MRRCCRMTSTMCSGGKRYIAGDAGATGITGREVAAESTGRLGSRVGIAPSELAPLAGAVIESKRHIIASHIPPTTSDHTVPCSFFFYFFMRARG